MDHFTPNSVSFPPNSEKSDRKGCKGIVFEARGMLNITSDTTFHVRSDSDCHWESDIPLSHSNGDATMEDYFNSNNVGKCVREGCKGIVFKARGMSDVISDTTFLVCGDCHWEYDLQDGKLVPVKFINSSNDRKPALPQSHSRNDFWWNR